MKQYWWLHVNLKTIRSSHQRCFVRKDALRNFAKFTGNHLWQGLFFNKVVGVHACNFIKKEALAQVFSCEFCKTSENIFLQNSSGRLPLNDFVCWKLWKSSTWQNLLKTWKSARKISAVELCYTKPFSRWFTIIFLMTLKLVFTCIHSVF